MKLSESIQMLGSPYFGFIDKIQFLDLMMQKCTFCLDIQTVSVHYSILSKKVMVFKLLLL